VDGCHSFLGSWSAPIACRRPPPLTSYPVTRGPATRLLSCNGYRAYGPADPWRSGLCACRTTRTDCARGCGRDEPSEPARCDRCSRGAGGARPGGGGGGAVLVGSSCLRFCYGSRRTDWIAGSRGRDRDLSFESRRRAARLSRGGVVDLPGCALRGAGARGTGLGIDSGASRTREGPSCSGRRGAGSRVRSGFGSPS
jgi:hypothetical protein